MNLPSDRRPDHESADDALRSGAAIGERDARALLEVTGADRARFLHGYLTCDVQGLAAGRVAYGFFTSREGRVLADAWVGALGDALVVSLPAERASAIEQHLARFILADRVTLRLRADLSSLHAAGPEAGRRLAESGLPAPEAAGLETLTRAEASWIVLRRDLGSISGFELWLPVEERDRVIAALAAAGARSVATECFEVARVEEGVPRFGVDFDDRSFPQETGLEAAAVSYTKGCYLGQEVVARIHYRGGVQRELRALRFLDALPAVGIAILHEGREAGEVTSAVHSPARGAIGLAMLHRRVGTPEAPLALADGGRAALLGTSSDAGSAPGGPPRS
ncbi:MAG: folate-binding protein YgfZ [Holophagales bacterium]|nr:MAG: folate-binding protein YgfZ [Holophagales bacterium]